MQTLNLSSLTPTISDRDLEELSRNNPDLRLETNREGNLIVMSPTGSITGEKNGDLLFQVKLWNRQTKLGKVFDSSTGFRLSNGAVRSPDVSWITINRWNALTLAQQRGFAPIVPDFVIELMSPTDILEQVQQKMKEYVECGVKLGWLINPEARVVEIYHQNQEVEILNNPQTLSGENILPGLVVELIEIFSD